MRLEQPVRAFSCFSWFLLLLPPLAEVLLPPFELAADVLAAAVGFEGAELDAADLARDGLRQVVHLEPADAFERPEPLARMGEDGLRGLGVRGVAWSERHERLG